MTAFSMDRYLIDSDGGGVSAGRYGNGPQGETGGTMKAENVIHVLHDAFFAEGFCAAGQLLLRGLEDKFNGSLYQLFSGRQDLGEG